jgi:hypothetical protein
MTVRAVRDSVGVARDPQDDERIYLRLGLAMSKAQLLEIALVKLMEVKQQDLSLPLDDRWAEISSWIDMTAGQLHKRLGVPQVMSADVQAAISRRNRIAHEVWIAYSVGNDSRASANTWVPWLEAEAAMLQQVVHGLARVRDRIEEVRKGGAEVVDADLINVWREFVPHAIAWREDRTPPAGWA